MGVVTFAGFASSDYGINVEHPVNHVIPSRDYENIHIPGRNGDLHIDRGSFHNVEREYEIVSGDEKTDYQTVSAKISEWLHSVYEHSWSSSYQRLEDTYEPDYFRMAMFVDEVEIDNILYHAGRAKIKFNCKPQRFLKSGETIITKTTPRGSINNPTKFDAAPILKVYGYGTLGVGTNTIQILEYPTSIPYVEIDCDIMDAYYDATNLNEYVVLTNNVYPTIHPGLCNIALDGNITKVEIKPRWWTV